MGRILTILVLAIFFPVLLIGHGVRRGVNNIACL